MDNIQIKLSAIWAAHAMTWLLGDMLRIISGDLAKEMEGKVFTQFMWLGMAVITVIPIIMIVLTLLLNKQVNRWANIIVAILLVILNFYSVVTYPSYYDKFLLIVALGLNALTIWFAWNWA